MVLQLWITLRSRAASSPTTCGMSLKHHVPRQSIQVGERTTQIQHQKADFLYETFKIAFA